MMDAKQHERWYDSEGRPKLNDYRCPTGCGFHWAVEVRMLDKLMAALPVEMVCPLCAAKEISRLNNLSKKAADE